jgi:hypothetical protein
VGSITLVVQKVTRDSRGQIFGAFDVDSPSGPVLAIRVTIKNVGKNAFQCSHLSTARLADDEGNQFLPAQWREGTRVKDELETLMLQPGQTVEDLLTFSQANLGKGRYLLLDLWGEPGTVRLKIDQ